MNNSIPQDIFSFIEQEETKYQQSVDVHDGWEWPMKNHIQESFLYKHGQLLYGKNKGKIDEKPVKNIIPPILNVSYRAEDIDVRNITLYIEDPEYYHLSFLIKKYHDDKFVVENDLDTLLDEIKEEKIDFGGAIVMDIGQALPLQLRLQDIAFCNQHNLLSGPIGFKYYYSPSDLQEMEDRHWGDKNYGADISIEDLIVLAKNQKGQDGKEMGEEIEVYLTLGYLPEKYLNGNDSEKYLYQQQINAFYSTQDGKKGVTLFKVETKNPLKIHLRDRIHNRALGWGGVEELFEDYVWTNYSMIRKKEMLDSVSKIIMLTDDSELAAKHPYGLKGVDNLEIIETKEGKRGLWQPDIYPRAFALFDNSVNEFWEHAQTTGFAHDPMLGIESKAGTPFRAQERQVIEGKSVHDYRKGKYAKFIEEMYQDWFIPYISKQITKGVKFLSELSLKEMQFVVDKVVTKKANKFVIERLLEKKFESPEEVAAFKDEVEVLKQVTREEFMKDNKKFIEILKDELKDAPIKVKVDVAGKQTNLADKVDKLTNILRYVMSTFNPQTGQFAVFQDPRMTELFNQIIEGSGFSPVDFASEPSKEAMPLAQMPMPQQNAIQPIQA